MRKHIAVVGAVIVGVLASGCGRAKGGEQSAAVPDAPSARQGQAIDWALGLFGPLDRIASPGDPVTEAKAALGRRLYHEPRLSNSGKVSCNSCHPLDSWGTTSRPVVPGDAHVASRLDIPTVYNAAVAFDLFWDGRAHNVEEQARGSILSPLEMAMPNEAAVVARLRESPEYRGAFRAAFPSEPDPVTFDNVGRALGAFERRLVTPSRWDEFLRGDRNALTDAEKKGFDTFVSKGCSDCHNGPAVGGRMYQVVGEVRPWPLQSDSGRYSATRKHEDLFVFRVPPLRNIEKTGPYFDTGVVTDLSEAVRLMAKYQRGMNLTENEIAEILTWLRTLTGEVPREYVAPPARSNPSSD